MATIIVMYKA